MATPNETIRYGLLHYPTLYANPIDVLISVFLGVGTHNWHLGEVDHSEWDKSYKGKMRYDAQFISKKDDSEFLASINLGRELKEQVELARMQFIDKNIEQILEAPHDSTYFGKEPNGLVIVNNMWHVTYNDQSALKLPKTLTQEWAIELCTFVQYIIPRICGAYQMGDGKTHDEWTKHWPVEAKRAFKVLRDAEEQFYPIAYGKTKKEHDDKVHALMTEMLAEIKQDELDAKK